MLYFLPSIPFLSEPLLITTFMIISAHLTLFFLPSRWVPRQSNWEHMNERCLRCISCMLEVWFIATINSIAQNECTFTLNIKFIVTGVDVLRHLQSTRRWCSTSKPVAIISIFIGNVRPFFSCYV
jgi:hypothetical protein